MSDFDDVHESWKKAKREYDLAERNLAMARARLTDADRSKQAEWDKLVERARVSATAY
jgi:hypothetical protein